MTHDEIKLGDSVMTPLGKGEVKRIGSTMLPCCVLLDSEQFAEARWFDRSHLSPFPQEKQVVGTLFTPIERRNRVWELAARIFMGPNDATYKQCVEMAEKLMVEFEATYNKEPA